MASSTQLKPNATYALQQAAKLLDLPDTNRLRTALICAACEELKGNPRLFRQVRALYDAVVPGRQPSFRSKWVQLIPIHQALDEPIDLFAPVDPYWIVKIYGPSQLPTALNMFPLSALKEAATKVESRHAGTKPKNRGRKADVVAYIVEQVTADTR